MPGKKSSPGRPGDRGGRPGDRRGGPGESARKRSAAFRAAERRREKRRKILLWAGTAVVVLGAAGGISAAVVINSGSSHAAGNASSGASMSPAGGPAGPEGIPLEEGSVLAPASTSATGQTVDGIQCNSNEQVVYHIHTHLAVYVDGQLRPIPPGIGIVTPVAQQTKQGAFYGASRCYYWLHVHAQDGVIHIEAPSQHTYSLGQFFAIWQQPLSRTQVGPASGTLTVYVNGKPYSGDPSNIPLRSHEDVQIDVGSPVVAPKSIDWSKSQL